MCGNFSEQYKNVHITMVRGRRYKNYLMCEIFANYGSFMAAATKCVGELAIAGGALLVD